MTKQYTARDISVFSQVEGVRTHPGMYLGDVDASGTLQCLREVLHNATDEAEECGSKRIRVLIRGNVVTVADEGRGIPIEKHPKTGLSTLETVMTHLHAGAKAGEKTAYGKRTIGVHGVGASVVNALSSSMEVWSFRNNRWNYMSFAVGTPTAKLTVRAPPFKWRRGTIVRYRLDQSILPANLELSSARRLCDIARYFSPVDIAYDDGEKSVLLTQRTPAEWLERSTRREGLHYHMPPFVVNGGGVRMVVSWTNAPDTQIEAHVSGTPVPSGMHVRGLEEAIVAAVTTAYPKASKTCSNVLVGLRAVLDVTVDQPSFSGQNKTNLRTASARKQVTSAVTTPLTKYLRRNRSGVEAMLQHASKISSIDDSAEERKQLARDSKIPRGRLAFPKGFIAALSYPPAQRELILCEGDSAAGTLKDAKMPWQEVLPLRGKMANVINRKGAVTSSEVVRDILQVVGFDAREPSRPCRVGKILIMTDADDDGHHIAVLLLTIFHRVMPSLLHEGRIYLVNTPLFEGVTSGGQTVAGDSLSAMQQEYGKLTSVNRMKGLGGCAVPLLREMADPKTRKLLRVSAAGKVETAGLSALMGSDSTARKELLNSKAKSKQPTHGTVAKGSRK